MKNYFLSFVLAVLVVLTGLTLRRSVANAGQPNSGQNSVVAIGGTPPPPLPQAMIGGTPPPPLPQAIGGTPPPPLPQ